ncbi:serine protease [Picosynechococcus sp. PCC 7003]|uniref:HhoA/HhoB/HtrA family serine endopeptidase n=1 Tax=Picosynechococcus sp. PCC 7003 TaxID=374981 RepID=UPI0008104D19|nr:HhoA/HhoB/HtrA family serine endopeptidase [Picosynechococcus sp. PCC 7003]ANV85216.1 serine protease [Picosynechococcus sp. PCC 7003]
MLNQSFRQWSLYTTFLILGGSLGFLGHAYWFQRQLNASLQAYGEFRQYEQSLAELDLNSDSVNFIAEAVKTVGPTVVRIDALDQPEALASPTPLFKKFFQLEEGLPTFDGDRQPQGTGSGFILSSNGQLVTNAHVVGNSSKVKVTLKDGQIFEGKVMGVDKLTDIAVIKIEATGLPTAKLGRAASLTPGEWAIAIGNPLGFDNSVTVGIVSALDRPSAQVGIPDKRVRFIQTDAAINPGNSGGPLLNVRGEVIGLNTAIRADGQGLGFAIPIETAQRIAQQLFTEGKATHPYLGIRMLALDGEGKNRLRETLPTLAEELDLHQETGVLVIEVAPDSPAAIANIQEGDILKQVGEQPVLTAFDVQDAVERSSIGADLPIDLKRRGTMRQLTVQPAEFPS